jgi:hypothetical protein
MPQPFLNADGEEVEAFTKEEVEDITKERDEAKAAAEEAKTHLAAKTDEFVKAKQGFKKYSEMSEEEKGKLSADQAATMQQLEELKGNQEKERGIAKEAMFKAAAKGDEKVLEKIKEKYGMIIMPEGTTEEIAARINAVTGWAYQELGIVERKPMAIESTIIAGGNAPRSKQEGDTRYADTEEGKAKTNALFPHLAKDNK